MILLHMVLSIGSHTIGEPPMRQPSQLLFLALLIKMNLPLLPVAVVNGHEHFSIRHRQQSPQHS